MCMRLSFRALGLRHAVATLTAIRPSHSSFVCGAFALSARLDGNDGGQRQRERLVVHRRRSHHDAAVSDHQGTNAETDRFPATAKPRTQSGTGNVQVENESDGRGVQTVARNIRVHREYHPTPPYSNSTDWSSFQNVLFYIFSCSNELV